MLSHREGAPGTVSRAGLFHLMTDFNAVFDAPRNAPAERVSATVTSGVQAIRERARAAMAGGTPAREAVSAPMHGAPPQNDSGATLSAALRSCRAALYGVGVFSGVINVLMLTGAIYMLEIYDRVLASRSVPTLVGLSLLAAVLFLFQGFLDLIRGRILSRVGAAVDEAVGGRVFGAFVRSPLTSSKEGEGRQSLRDLESVRSFLAGPGPTALFDLPWMPVYLLVIFAFHPALGLTALIGAIVLVGLTVLTEYSARKPSRDATALGAARSNLADACRRNAEVAAAMGMFGRLEQKWREANASYIGAQREMSDITGGYGAFAKALRFMMQSAVLGVGAWLVIHNSASAGVIVAASILSGRALAPVDLAIAHWKGFVAARQSWRRLGEALRASPLTARALPLPAPKEKLAVTALKVGAPGQDRAILQDIAFTLEAGHGVGIIGPSGSGKSTLVRALVGAWRPAAGRIRLDGADLDQWAPEQLGRHIGYLPQDVELFGGTVVENIARFDRNAEAEGIIAAARAAGVHELIVGLRDGYGAEIGEHGEALSAGQRQRIALARALYGNPFLVVLDEPNSNLDSDGEAALTQAIAGVRARGGVVVIVAHRPSALAEVDYILALDRGRVRAFGPKEEVFAQLFPGLKVRGATIERPEAPRPEITREELPRRELRAVTLVPS